VGPCLSWSDLRGYRFPDPAREYRFEGLGEWCRKNRGHYTILWVGDLWERATFMRGMGELLLDVALHTRFVRRLLEGIAGYILETMRALFARFDFDGIAVSDDYGTQAGMIMAPDAWRRLVRPFLGKIYDQAHKHGRTVLHHSCGNLLPVIPDLIGIGLDILHPIQPEAMDVLALKREFGRDLTLCGGLGTQRLLPRGSPEEIRREVRRLKKELGRGGGYILEPGITLQADVPLPNMLAMIEEAKSKA
jgi:uroporphyrinogen decarboxylase